MVKCPSVTRARRGDEICQVGTLVEHDLKSGPVGLGALGYLPRPCRQAGAILNSVIHNQLTSRLMELESEEQTDLSFVPLN